MIALNTLAASLLIACAAAPTAVLAQPAGYASANTPGGPRILQGGFNAAGAEPALYNRLRVGTLVEFDKSTATVGEAMASLLAPVGYGITQRTVDPALSTRVWNRPLPPAAREAGVMTIEAAILLLIGEENRLVVDHANRLVAVEGAAGPVAVAVPPAAAPAPVTPPAVATPPAARAYAPRPWALNARKDC